MNPSFIVAKSHRDAIATMEVDWGWRRSEHPKYPHRLAFDDPDGTPVIYASGVHTLRGLPIHAKIYLGYGAESLSDEVWGFIKFHRARGGCVEQPDRIDRRAAR